MSRTMRVCACGASFAPRRTSQQYCSLPCAHEALKTDPALRFWAKVAVTPGCWLWLGSRNYGGYGHFSDDKRRIVMAHRYAYETLVGPVPAGLELDHVKARGCTHRNCVNPAHLEPVTRRENALRGDSFAAHNARLTHCKHGHPFDAANTFIRRNGKGRVCRACIRNRYAAIARARREANPRPPATHCRRGHPFTAENTYVNRGKRHCATCRKVAWQRNNAQRGAARKEVRDTHAQPR